MCLNLAKRHLKITETCNNTTLIWAGFEHDKRQISSITINGCFG